MLRRDAISLLLATSAGVKAATSKSLTPFFEASHGTGLLVDVKSRKLLAIHGAGMAGGLCAPPGSSIKPFVLAALLRSKKLTPDEPFFCPRRLDIGKHSFDCTHPSITTPMKVRTALAYSCNCFIAHFADRFETGELAQSLERAGLGSLTGLVGPLESPGNIQPASGVEANRLQALGESRVAITPAGLAMGYRSLALAAARPEMQSILEGMEDAVEFGTAQLARLDGIKLAGKTGSIRTSDGARMAWFGGFAPSRAPEVAIAVMVQGRSGGADAAPIAGKILAAYRAGDL